VSQLAPALAGNDVSYMYDPNAVELRLLQRMSPEAKLAVMQSLIRQAYSLKEAWVKLNHPDLAEAELRHRVRRLVTGATT
jgi:hypothetical protein